MRPRALLLAIIISFCFSVTARADGPAYHTVAYGETLYSIARSYGTSPDVLARLNGLTINSWVYAGQTLRVSTVANSNAPTTTPSGYYTVRAGDTLISIAAQFKVAPLSLASANDIPDNGFIYVGWKLKIPSSASPAAPASTNATYIVQSGDSLADIALQYDTTPQAIIIANNLQTSWLIVPGQRLVVPSRSAPVNTAAPAPNVVPAPNVAPALNLRLTRIPLYRQHQTLTCEEAATAMALRGAVSEAQVVNAMPRSDNPFYGIRGRTNSPVLGGLTDYGTYAHGLQKGLAALGYLSTVLYNMPYVDFKNALLANLRAGKPVIWWTTWHDTYQRPVWVKTSGGSFVKLVPYEHTVVIVGANDRGITYNDPYDATIRFVSWASHQRLSAYFDNMALVVQ